MCLMKCLAGMSSFPFSTLRWIFRTGHHAPIQHYIGSTAPARRPQTPVCMDEKSYSRQCAASTDDSPEGGRKLMCGRYQRKSDKQRIAEAFSLGNINGLALEL